MVRRTVTVLVLAAGIAGCQPSPATPSAGTGGLDAQTQPGVRVAEEATAPDFTATPGASPTRTGPLAYVNGRPLAWAQIEPPLLEAAGGEILAETILAMAIGQRLGERGVKLTPESIAREQEILTQSLASDPDKARALLQELRRQRRWGEVRFRRLLERNAGLRMLVQDEVQVTEASLQEAYEFDYGPKYEIRLIVVPPSGATEVIRRARAGESFADLAIQLSTDVSRAQGGLLSPISPVDKTYPAALLAAMTRLAPGQVSDPIVLEQSVAIIKLERKIDGGKVKFDDVKNDLAPRVRRRIERFQMERLALAMLKAADVVVTDAGLARSWRDQRDRLGQEAP